MNERMPGNDFEAEGDRAGAVSPRRIGRQLVAAVSQRLKALLVGGGSAALPGLLLGILLLTGCAWHTQHYVILSPDGHTNVVARIDWGSCFHKDNAAEMDSKLVLPGIEHTLSGKALQLNSDPESIKATGNALGQVIAQAIDAAKKIQGLP